MKVRRRQKPLKECVLSGVQFHLPSAAASTTTKKKGKRYVSALICSIMRVAAVARPAFDASLMSFMTELYVVIQAIFVVWSLACLLKRFFHQKSR